MADATAHVHEYRSGRIAIFGFLFDWINGKPRLIGLSAPRHEIVEEAQLLGVLGEPRELMHVCIPCLLKYGVERICWSLVIPLLHECWERLILGSDCFEAMSFVRLDTESFNE